MATKPFQHKRPNRNGPRPKYVPLGTDSLTASHVYRTTDDTVHVVRDGKRTHIQRLAGSSVTDWMKHVEQSRGWDTEQYGQSLVEILKDSVEGGE